MECFVSQEWFSERIESLATSLAAGHVAYIIPSTDSSSAAAGSAGPRSYLMSDVPSDSTITTLRSLARHYSDISELCVLALHVEVSLDENVLRLGYIPLQLYTRTHALI